MSLIGTNVPALTLLSHERKPVSLTSFEGKKLVIAFYPAAFTGVCQKEMCAFRDSLSALNGLNAQVVGISVDAPFSNAAFAERNNLSFPLLSDYNRAAIQAFGVVHNDFAGMAGYAAAKRSVFVVNEHGKITYEWVAPNPGVEPDYDAVKAALH